MVRAIKEKIVEPNERSYDDVLVHTNRIHTDVFKGGKTDATLEYFNVKDYFKMENIVEYFTINKNYIQHYLKKNVLEEIYKNGIQ